MDTQSTFNEMLSILHRGGSFGHWWNVAPNGQGKRSEWWKVGSPSSVTNGVVNAYFGIHPVTVIPPTNRHGEVVPPEAVRTQIQYVAAINCLFGEFDRKKNTTQAMIEALEPAPSVIVDSGGGWHVYWLLDEPWTLTTADDRETAKSVQARWVSYVGSDDDAKDLARVLRVPGTHNLKYAHKPMVSFVKADLALRYSLSDLLAYLPAEAPTRPVATPKLATRISDDPRTKYALAAFNGEIASVALAGDGEKHKTLRDAAVKLGTLVARGLLTEHEVISGLENAIVGKAKDFRNAQQTIRDGLAYGMNDPRDIPEPALPQPTMRNGVAHCPNHNTPLVRSKNGNGWRCAGGDFWWQGENYAPPLSVVPKGVEVVTSEDAPAQARRLYHVSELYLLPPVQWLVKDEILDNGISVICAPSQSGKSFHCVDRTCRLAVEGKTVVYIAAEGASGYRQRIRAWGLHHKVDTDKLPIYFYPKPVYFMKSEDAIDFIGLMADIRPNLVVIDTLLRCMSGGDVNSNADMSVFIDNCGMVKDAFNCGVQIVHHTNKSGKDLGAVALFNASDVFLSLENNDGFLTLTQNKSKDSERADPKTYQLVQVKTDITNEDGNPITSCVIEASGKVVQMRGDKVTATQALILDFLDLEVFSEAGCPSSKIAAAKGISESTLYNTLSTLKKLGYISQGKRGDPFSITGAGQSALHNYQNSIAQKSSTEQLPKSSQVVRSRFASVESDYQNADVTTSHQDALLQTTKQLPNNYQSSQPTTTTTLPLPPSLEGEESSSVGSIGAVQEIRTRVAQAETALEDSINRATPEVRQQYEKFEGLLLTTKVGTEDYNKLMRTVEHYIAQGGQFGNLLQAHVNWSKVASELEDATR